MSFIQLNGVSDLFPNKPFIHRVDPRKIESIESNPYNGNTTVIHMDSKNSFPVKESAIEVLQKMQEVTM